MGISKSGCLGCQERESSIENEMSGLYSKRVRSDFQDRARFKKEIRCEGCLEMEVFNLLDSQK